MRKFMVNVNGNSYEVEVEETSSNSRQVAPVEQAPVVAPVKKATPIAAAPAPQAKAAPVPQGGIKLTAPLPGTVLKFTVPNGSTVKENDVVLIIEAMKMENEIRANASGVITFIAAQGANVNSGDVIASIG